MPKIKILKVSKNIRDIFWGNDGWEPHTRVYLSRAGGTLSLSHMGGTKLPLPVRNAVLAALGE